MRLPLRDRVVLVTGAASGIGAALAQELAQYHVALALVDMNSDGLQRTAHVVRSAGCRVHTYHLDVTNQSEMEALPSRIEADLGTVSILINNAGVALAGRFDQVTGEQFDRVMQINFAATVSMTRLFLPQLRANTPSQIVNLSSIFGIVGVPGQVAYCSSKFAVRGFSEALRLELASSGVGVTVVHPGGVRTNIARNAEMGQGMSAEERSEGLETADKLLRMSPEQAAQRILRGMVRRQRRIIVGADARLLTALQRLLPARYGQFFPRG